MSFEFENVEQINKERRDRDYERFLSLQTRFDGARALYREGMGVSLVRIEFLRPTALRFVAGIELIPTRGLYNKRPPKWQVSATWDTFGFSHDSWACANISMTANFDAGIIDAVAAHAIVVEPEEYSFERMKEIWKWMHEYRRARLAKHRRQLLELTWQGQPIAQLADHWLAEYPEVSSRAEAESLSPEMREALNTYGAWLHSDGDRAYPDLPFGESLFIGWRVATPDGENFETSIPEFDFTGGRVVWRCGGLAVADTTQS